MTYSELAELHSACFTAPAPWSAKSIASTLETPGAFLLTAPQAMLIGRIAADEAELLTLAVAPAARRTGVAHALVEEFLRHSNSAHAVSAFLEVAANNTAAISLYLKLNFSESGRRKNYYKLINGTAADALVMVKQLKEPQ